MTTGEGISDATALRYELTELAERLGDVIALGRGDPDSPTPAHIVAAAKAAIDRGETGPGPIEGLPALREAIAAKLARENGLTVDPAGEVLVTTGGQEAIYLLMQAVLSPGDEVVTHDPRYSSYDEAIKSAGGRLALAPTFPEDGFVLRPEEVERRITPRTRVLLLISPNNPTASMIPLAALERLAELANRHDLLVVSDEIYERFTYDGNRHHSIAALPGMRERTVTLNGVSKTYAMTGWRIGYVAGPAEVIAAMTRLKAALSGCAPVVSQHAAIAALDGPQECVEAFRRLYTERRALMCEALAACGFRFTPPQGAFYIWADSSGFGLPALRISERLLKEGRVLIFPGDGFGAGWGNYMRVTLLQPTDMLREAARRMRAVLAAPR